MARPKSERHSADLTAEIARLEGERKRLVQSEDQRRGSVLRELLAQSKGDELRGVLAPLITPRDAFLFGLESSPAPRLSSKGNRSRERVKANDSSAENARRPNESAKAS